MNDLISERGWCAGESTPRKHALLYRPGHQSNEMLMLAGMLPAPRQLGDCLVDRVAKGGE